MKFSGKLVIIDAHAKQRMLERGATEQEVFETVEKGMNFPARKERTAYCMNFSFGKEWRGEIYPIKHLKVIVAEDSDEFVVVTVYVFYF